MTTDNKGKKNGTGDKKSLTPQRTVARLALYRRMLLHSKEEGKKTIYSHELGEILGINPPQVRRDLMEVGFEGHPRRGYEIDGLLTRLDVYFGMDQGLRMVLVGVGNLGRALLNYFVGKQAHIAIEAAFDKDPAKVGRAIGGCHCYSLEQLPALVASQGIHVGIIAVPAAEAQKAADLLVKAGVRGLVNLAPAWLRVPPSVFVEDIDITLSIEKVGYFAKMFSQPREAK
ncbi:MAG: redox-sensing transcriptional repressor Rex [Elusimicrobiota bacterium]|jgi:redox-sensing transcriptional repressor